MQKPGPESRAATDTSADLTQRVVLLESAIIRGTKAAQAASTGETSRTPTDAGPFPEPVKDQAEGPGTGQESAGPDAAASPPAAAKPAQAPATDKAAKAPPRAKASQVPAVAKTAPVPAKRKAAPAPTPPVAPPARPARPRTRHTLILGSFVLLVLAPIAVAAWYLWARAADQYVSELGFTVRREESSSAAEILGGLSNFSSSGSSDADVLYEFIQSQEIVQQIDTATDLRTLYSQHHAQDPVFSFNAEGSIEDLVAYWRRMVQISYNPGSGLLELHVFAFTPQDARNIAQKILDNSSDVINEISAIAREDAMRYARADLETAKAELRDAREALTRFRTRTRIVDPSADLQGQMGLLTTLQQQLAAAIIDLDILNATTSQNDPRIKQVQLRIDVIRKRIEEERSKFGSGGAGVGDQDYPTLVAEFERLTVEREFAEQAYTAALSTFGSARAEAERQSRYLAAYVRPTLAESPGYPRRVMLLGLVALFLTLAWAILVLIYYSLRDRQ